MNGVDLAAAYAEEVVGPLFDSALPGMPVALARIGSGSDVLSLDDAVSHDHDWGLRLTVMVPTEDVGRVDELLEARLPAAFRGYPTRFPVTWDARRHHRAEVTSVLAFARFRTGLDLSRPLDAWQWLSLTGQSVLELTAGPVFRDDGGTLSGIRELLRAYPDDIRRFAVASGWQRIEQELPFVRRTAARGDEAGSRAIAARLAVTAMHIGFLLEQRWPPYSKWLGTAFAALPAVGYLVSPLRAALSSESGPERESALVEVIESLAAAQGEVGLPTLNPAVERFWDRDSRGLRGLPAAVQESILDEEIRGFPLVGTPELWTDNVDLLTRPERRMRVVRALLGAGDPAHN